MLQRRRWSSSGFLATERRVSQTGFDSSLARFYFKEVLTMRRFHGVHRYSVDRQTYETVLSVVFRCGVAIGGWGEVTLFPNGY